MCPGRDCLQRLTLLSLLALCLNYQNSTAAFPVSVFQVSSDRLVDLTHQLDANSVYWPGSPSFVLESLADGLNGKGFYYRSKWFSTSEHGGTHLDAPSHFNKDGIDAGQIPINQLSGLVVVIDIRAAAALNPDHQVSTDDISSFESQHGPIPEGAFIFMNSGWDKKWPIKEQTLGSASPSDSKTFHFPGFHPDATKFLVAQRKIRGVGVDTPSTDYGQSELMGTHVELAKHNLIGLENVANLDQIPATGAHVVVSPMKIKGGSGAPVRIFAVLPSLEDGCLSNRAPRL